MTENIFGNRFNLYQDFGAELLKKEETLKTLNGHVHFILGHARSSTSISAKIADEYDDTFVFYEDNQTCHARMDNFPLWYENTINVNLKVRQYIKSYIEDYQFDQGTDGVEAYKNLVHQGKTVYSKYALGPHGDYYWQCQLKNFPLYHHYFQDSRYLLAYREPEKAIQGMYNFFANLFDRKESLDALIDTYNRTIELQLYVARNFKKVFYLNDSTMTSEEVRAVYRRFLEKDGSPIEKYTSKAKAVHENTFSQELKSHSRYKMLEDQYQELENLHTSQRKAEMD